MNWASLVSRLPARERLVWWTERLLLVIGTCVWLVSHMSVVNVLWSRPSGTLPHLDDSLSYILRGPMARECFFQDCPAISDLREQATAPTKDWDPGIERFQGTHRFLVIYAPLHTALLMALNAAGMSWEDAYRTVWTVGYPFLALAMAYWLAVLWGMGAAGLAMLMLSVHHFFGIGLHVIIPGNLTLAIAMICWGRIAATKGRAPLVEEGGVRVRGIHQKNAVDDTVGKMLLQELSRAIDILTDGRQMYATEGR